MLDGITDSELDARPFDGEWTAREIVHHLADGELSSAVRLRRLVAEEQPVIAGYDEGLHARRLYYDVRPIEASLEIVRAAREASATILDHLTADEWARTGTHSEMGAYGVEVWLGVYAEHPYAHAEQAREVLKAVRDPRP